MSSVVKAMCPGCRQVLRIPVELVERPIRCKHCGAVLNPKARPPAPREAAPAGTPNPPARKAPVAAPDRAESDRPTRRREAPPEEENESPFADLTTSEASAPRSRPRGRTGGGWWKGLLVVLGVSVIAGGLLAVAWTRIVSLLRSPALAEAIEAIDSAVKEPPKSPGPVSNPQPGPAPPGEAPRAGTAFPRRLLVISVHNYLFADPVPEAAPGARGPAGHDVHALAEKLGQGFKVPPTQVAHLSDAAAKNQARPPLKPVIENTLTGFLESSRTQDRVLVFFIGHAAEVGDEAYLVPIEGELDSAATLIPLKWVYEQLTRCKARQKVLVLDVNRVNPTRGQERPGGGPMGPKLDEALKNPPPGVQVWSSCSAAQASYETDANPQGVFLEALCGATLRGVQGKIQKPDDPLPVEYYCEAVNTAMQAELTPQKLTQVSRLTGREEEAGAAYDPAEAAPPAPVLAGVPAKAADATAKLVEGILDEVDLPPVKATREGGRLRSEWLPSFPEAGLKDYQPDAGSSDEQKKVRQSIHHARVVLWAVSTAPPPAKLAQEVKQVKQEVKFDLSILQDGYRFNANEKQFKDKVFKDEKNVARILDRLSETLDELKGVEGDLEKEGKRWRADYDFVRARLEMELAYVTEYQSMLGQMRKELPPRDPNVHGGWRLASTAKPQGDSAGRKLAGSARKTLDKIVADYTGTPWEILAKRERLTALGLEWQPAK
jgi:hypothetical protein